MSDIRFDKIMEEEKLLILFNYAGTYDDYGVAHGFIKIPIVKDFFMFYINGVYEKLYIVDTFIYHNELKKHIPIIIGVYNTQKYQILDIVDFRINIITIIADKLKNKTLDLSKFYRKTKIQKLLKDSESK